MRTHLLLVSAAALLLAGPAPAADKKDEKKEAAIELEIKGTLRTGVVAVGGETTGAVISTKGGFTCEVDGLKDKGLDKKAVVAKGSFAVKEGVEVKQRRILTAGKVEEAKEKPDESYVKAKITGKVATGVVAPGGATTGKTITAGGVTWELDTSKDKDLAAAAEKLNGKGAVVEGTVEVKKSNTGRAPRTIVAVTSLKAAEK